MKTGIYDVSEREYMSDQIGDTPSLSASIAKILIAESPLHAWTNHPKLNPDFKREEKEVFDLGTVAHALMLQGESIAEVIHAPDWRTKDAQMLRDKTRTEGRVPILSKHWDRVKEMVAIGQKQISEHREAKDAFTDAGKPEQTLIWVDDHGVVCRSRLDWLRNDYKFIYDYKTLGRTANPDELTRITCTEWALQACFYLRGLKAVTGVEATMRFVAQETEPPYAVSVIGLGPDVLCIGQKQVQFAIDLWAKCLESGRWPGFPDRVCFPVLPAWQEAAWLEKELR